MGPLFAFVSSPTRLRSVHEDSRNGHLHPVAIAGAANPKMAANSPDKRYAWHELMRGDDLENL